MKTTTTKVEKVTIKRKSNKETRSLNFYYSTKGNTLILHSGAVVWAVNLGGVTDDTPIETYLLARKASTIAGFLSANAKNSEFLTEACEYFLEYLKLKTGHGKGDTPQTLEEALGVIKNLTNRLAKFHMD